MPKKHLAEAQKCLKTDWGLLLSLGYRGFLSRQRILHHQAIKEGNTECIQCGYCCLRRPCIPTPKEVQAVASYLDIPVEKLVKTYMVVDKSPSSIYFLVWAQETQQDLTGTLLPYNRTYDRGYCVFFNRKTHNCKIHPVKPRVAKLTNCWVEHKDIPNPVDSWKEKSIYNFLPDFQPEDY